MLIVEIRNADRQELKPRQKEVCCEPEIRLVGESYIRANKLLNINQDKFQLANETSLHGRHDVSKSVLSFKLGRLGDQERLFNVRYSLTVVVV